MLDKLYAKIEDFRSILVELETLLTKHPALSPESGGRGRRIRLMFWKPGFCPTELRIYGGTTPPIGG